MVEIIYINGRLVPRPRARVSALDHGFLYGHGAFETLRSYSGRFFRMEGHPEAGWTSCSKEFVESILEQLAGQLDAPPKTTFEPKPPAPAAEEPKSKAGKTFKKRISEELESLGKKPRPKTGRAPVKTEFDDMF